MTHSMVVLCQIYTTPLYTAEYVFLLKSNSTPARHIKGWLADGKKYRPAMQGIAYAYLAYFTALYASAVFWGEGNPKASAGIALAVVLLHFVFGFFKALSAPEGFLSFTRKRYLQSRVNAAADALLVGALAVLIAYIPHEDTTALLYTGVGLATVGNSFCLLQHMQGEPFVAAGHMAREGDRFVFI